MTTTVKGFLIGEKGKRTVSTTPEVFTSEKIGDYIILTLDNSVNLDTGELIDGGVTAFAGDKDVLMKIKPGFKYTKGA